MRTIDETSSGVKSCCFSVPAWTRMSGLCSAFATTANGQCFMSAWIAASSMRRPMRRLASKIVFSGFMPAWFAAALPTRRPSSVKATHDGVVRSPDSFEMMSTRSFFHTPTQE
eukprot:Amastigsp_a96_3797.p5 type:complete len:113 gc:universal Amastigsp_a96_3797:446-108(-)